MTMACPTDQTELRITDRSGIEIDWCPTCRGVWLDRGELDKIIDRTAEALPARGGSRDDDDRGPARGGRWDDDRERDAARRGWSDDDRDDDDRRPRGRRRGVLGDLFDFG